MACGSMIHVRRVAWLLLVHLLVLSASSIAVERSDASPATGAASAVSGPCCSHPPPAATAPVAFSLDGILGDRTRMIQVTVIVVAIGIGLLMWGKS